MKKNQSNEFFVGIKNSLFITLPFYLLLNWVGLAAIPIYFVGALCLTICFVYLPHSIK